MKVRLKKQQHNNDVAPLMPAAVQSKLLPNVRSMDSPFTNPETAQRISQEEQGRDKGFNFGEVPIFAAGSGFAASPLQRKFTVSLARGKQEGQAAGLQGVTTTQVGQQQPVQRSAEEQEDPMQGKLEPVQREGEEEDPMQGKLEPVQREGEEEDPMQGKLEPVQREGEEEEPAQAKGESEQKVKGTQQQINLAPSGSGKPMPEPVQQKMEGAFGADFSGVRIHEGAQAKAINAIAYTQGSDIHFQPGKYQPETQSGQELLGHELTHVVQQKAGRVTVPQGKGAPINADAGLESEADILGAKAARGESVEVAGATSTILQRKWLGKNSQVLTAKNDISLKQSPSHSNIRQGQKLSKPESTNAMQQSSESAIQMKRGNIDLLPEEYVSKSSLYKLSNKTEDIQKQINNYNKIDESDTNHENHGKILGEIMKLSRLWLTEHQNLDSKKDKNKDKEFIEKKVEAVVKVRSDAALEKQSVENQRSLSENPESQNEEGNVYTEKLFGSKKLDVAANVGGGAYGIAQGETIKATGKGISDQPFVLEIIGKIKELFGIAKESAAEAAKRTSGEAILGSAEWIQMALGKLFVPVLMLPLAIRSFWKAKTYKQALSDRKDALEEKAKYGNLPEEEQQLLKDVLYGFNKVKRRFYSAIYGLVDAGIDLVSTVLGVLIPGMGTAVAAAVSLGKSVLNGFKTLIVKTKGVLKYFTGIRGKNRTESAERTVNLARDGNQEALQLLVGLGFAKTTQEMYAKLEEQRTDKRNSFVKEVAEKLKSQT